MHWPRDVLELLLAHVIECDIELVSHLVVHHSTDADAARLVDRFKARRDVDPVSIDVAAVPDDVAEVDAHAELNAAFGRHIGVALGHPLLHFDRAAYRVDDAGELDQQAVAGGLDDATAVPLDHR